MKKILAPFLLVILLPLSCNPVAVKSVADLAGLGIQVVTLLKGCSELCDIFSAKVMQVNLGMENGIKEGRPLVDLGKYWEKYWGDVHEHYDDIVDKLNATNAASQQYFIELDRNNREIVDTILRRQDLEQTIIVKNRYDQEFSNAQSALIDAQVMLQKGDDLMLVLRNNVLRNAIEGQIITLNEITKQSESLTANINSFSTKCIPLFVAKN